MKLDLKNTLFLLDMFLIVGGEGSSNRNASRDESVEAGDKSVEAGDESIEAGEKTPQSCYNSKHTTCPVPFMVAANMLIMNSLNSTLLTHLTRDTMAVIS